MTIGILKEIPKFSADTLCHLIQSIKETRTMVAPTLKMNNNPNKSNSFIFVSNVKIIKKVVEHVLRYQVQEYLEAKNITPKNHHKIGQALVQFQPKQNWTKFQQMKMKMKILQQPSQLI